MKALYKSVIAKTAEYVSRGQISPDFLSLTGFLLVAIAAFLVSRRMLIPSAIFLAVGGMLDSLDGAVARRSGKVTKFGAFLDSFLDRLGELLIFLGIFFYFRYSDTALSAAFEWLTILALGSSFMISYTRARIEGLQARCRIGFLQRHWRFIILIAMLLLTGLANPHCELSSSANYLVDIPLKFGLLFILGAGIFTIIQRVNRAREVLK